MKSTQSPQSYSLSFSRKRKIQNKNQKTEGLQSIYHTLENNIVLKRDFFS